MTTAHLDIRPAPWMDNARCTEVDPELFHGEHGLHSAEAKAICGGCDVRATCLQWALDNNEPHGILGGLNPNERRRLKKKLNRRTA